MPTRSSEIHIARHADLGRITLDRPKVINALSHAMITRLGRTLTDWDGDPDVAAVVIDGTGERGLCAGGDVRAIHASACADGQAARALWRDEYRLNARIARYRKPICVLMHGLVLGGGVGISAHASLRVVTDNSRVGMPEVTIGMVPDVGGTWLLARAPGELGTHLALTGAAVGPADAIACGLADVYLPAAGIRLLRTAKIWNDVWTVTTTASRPAPGRLWEQRSWIDACYAADSVDEILTRLQDSGVPEAVAAAQTIRAKSPTALAVTLRALRIARELPSLAHALDQEYRVACTRLRHPDLAEGIRAQVIDKDRRPRWSPATSADVDPAAVDRHFDRRGSDELGLVPAMA